MKFRSLECYQPPYIRISSLVKSVSTTKHFSKGHIKDNIKMPSEATITTPLAAGIKEEAVIASLHDHDVYIKVTCPQLISYKKISGEPVIGEACVYEVTDKRPIGQTTFRLTLVNQPKGIDATVDGKAPTGSIHIESKWSVTSGRIEENIAIESNAIMKKMIKGSVEKSHPEHHQNFVQAAQA